jgi:hypothetical protein
LQLLPYLNLKENRGKLRALYYETLLALSVEQIILHSSINQNEQYLNYLGNNEDSLEKLVLDEAEQLFNRIVIALTSKCMNEIDVDAKSIAHVSQLSNMLSNPSTYIIPEVSEDKISIDMKDNNNNNNNYDDMMGDR